MTLIVNGEKIDDSLIEQQIEHLKPRYQQVFKDQPPQQQQARLLEWSKENVIEMTLLNQYARQNAPDLTEEEIQKALEKVREKNKKQQKDDQQPDNNQDKQLREAVIQQLRVEKTIDDLHSKLPEPTDRQIADYYNRNKKRFTSTERVKISHIVKHVDWQTTEDKVRRIMTHALDELNRGTPFETVAQKYSDCPEKDGDLGFIEPGKMVEEFENVAFNLGPNQISDIFQTRFGYHIVKLYDRKPAVLKPLDEVRKIITTTLKEQAERKAVENFIDNLKANADIKES